MSLDPVRPRVEALQPLAPEPMGRMKPEMLRGEPGRTVNIEDGTGGANGVRVNGDNNMGVEARFANDSVVTTSVNVGTASMPLVGETAGRIQFTVQNLDDVNDLHLHLGSGSATTNDLKLGPGEMYSLPPGASFDGPMAAIAAPAAALAVVVEYKLPTA